MTGINSSKFTVHSQFIVHSSQFSVLSSRFSVQEHRTRCLVAFLIKKAGCPSRHPACYHISILPCVIFELTSFQTSIILSIAHIQTSQNCCLLITLTKLCHWFIRSIYICNNMICSLFSTFLTTPPHNLLHGCLSRPRMFRVCDRNR